MSKLLALILVLTASAVQAETKLLMIEEHGCYWCGRWNKEIGPIYPKTAEGRTAPLTRVDISESPPPGVTLDKGAFYTPTFVLLVDGKEAGRIEGYPGDEFFWFLLGDLIEDAGLKLEPGS